jgi:hypothetical protein
LPPARSLPAKLPSAAAADSILLSRDLPRRAPGCGIASGGPEVIDGVGRDRAGRSCVCGLGRIPGGTGPLGAWGHGLSSGREMVDAPGRDGTPEPGAAAGTVVRGNACGNRNVANPGGAFKRQPVTWHELYEVGMCRLHRFREAPIIFQL